MTKNTAAVALGKIRSAKKADAARANGKRPCAPGKKRGRPAKQVNTPVSEPKAPL